MEETFEIPVTYKGEELSFTASLLNRGYTYAIRVLVNGQYINFEPDEEKNFRAWISPEEMEAGAQFDKMLLEAIAGTLKDAMES